MGTPSTLEFRPSWAAWFWTLALTFGLAFPYVWWRRRAVRYEITAGRVVRHTGRLSSSTDEFQTAQITRVKTQQSLTERLFNVGTITVDTGVDAMTLRAVPNQDRVAAAIRDRL